MRMLPRRRPDTFNTKLSVGDMAIITKGPSAPHLGPRLGAGAAREAFTDSDTFTMEFKPEANLTPQQKVRHVPCTCTCHAHAMHMRCTREGHVHAMHMPCTCHAHAMHMQATMIASLLLVDYIFFEHVVDYDEQIRSAARRRTT